MRANPDFTGKTVGNWKCGEPYSKIYGKSSVKKTYPCVCIKCGNKKEITSSDLNRGKNLQCKTCNDLVHSYQDDNLTGTRQGSFLIGEAFRRNGRTYYHVKCDCSREYDILRDNLIRKNYRHCKCHGSAVIAKQKYGMLLPIKRLENGKWLCKCDCGKICEKRPSYMLKNAKDGSNISCGCKKNANRVAIRSDNKSGIKGVHQNSKNGKWVAYINKEGQRYNLGTFDSKHLASEARQKAETMLFGD